MGGAERQRVQQLQPRQRQRRRIERHRRPAQRAADRADHQQHGRLKERRQPSREREQHDLRDHAERPQRRDGRAVEAGGAPFQRREAVIDRVARLDQARRRQHRDESGIAQQMLARLCRLARPRGAGRQRRQRERRQRADAGSPPRSARSDGAPGSMSVAKPASEGAEDEGRRAPQPHRPIGAAARAEALERIGLGQRHHRREAPARPAHKRSGSRRAPSARPTST